MNRILRACLYQTMRKRVDESKLHIRHIEIPERELSYFNLSSNLIISFCHGGKQYYFRECPPRLKREAFFEREISRFFRTLDRLRIREDHFRQASPITLDFSGETISVFRGYLANKQHDPGFLDTISNTDGIARRMNFSIWEPQDYDGAFFEAFGFGDLPAGCRDIAVYFLWCMRGVCQTYRTIPVAYGKNYAYFSALKSVASSIVAEMLGLEELITGAEFCCLESEGGEPMLGLLCEAAPGSRMVDSRIGPCGSLQKELMALSLLDLICLQTDHGPNNYNVSVENGICRICAFDNDNPNTFFPLPLIGRGVLGCSKMIGADGLLNRPFVSRALYDRICDLRFREIRGCLKPYLNELQMAALMIRIRSLRAVLRKTAAKRAGFLLDDPAWNDRTAAAEMSGDYGTTYLTIATQERGKRK